MLIDKINDCKLEENLLSVKDFLPFPKADDRTSWTNVAHKTKTEWLDTAQKYLDFKWQALTADKFLNYNRKGDNLTYLNLLFERRSILGIFTLAECLGGEGRFLDQIINGIYVICEETTWMTPFDLSNKKEVLPAPEDVIVDLSCSETGSLLAWIHYLFKDKLNTISPRICERIEKEIKRRLILPYLEHNDYWWMGFDGKHRVNNWNPWCNKNMLMCFLLICNNPEERIAGIKKIMGSLDIFVKNYPPDGCCDEGPMYWGAAGGGLHVCLELIYNATNGNIDVFDDEMVKKIGSYIYKVHIKDDYFVDFADGDAKVNINPSVYYYGMDIKDDNMVNLGRNAQYLKPAIHNWFAIYDYIRDLLKEHERRKVVSNIPYCRDAWMDHTQVMTAREKVGSKNGFYIAAKGGNNAEAHNHNDVGNYIVYVDGRPLIIDLGTEEYTSKTFSNERYTLWYIQSQYHNCPTVNGLLQCTGAQYRAKNVDYNATDAFSQLVMDISDAYPKEAGILSWSRNCRLNRGENPFVEIIDEYYLEKATNCISINMMTTCEPKLVDMGTVELEYDSNKAVQLIFDEDNFVLEIERIDLNESRLIRNWGDTLYRLVFKCKKPVTSGLCSILLTNPSKN